jgi:hypothetical protein
MAQSCRIAQSKALWWIRDEFGLRRAQLCGHGFAELGVDTRSYPNGPFYGQHRWNLDFTIAKTTKVTERVGTTFYAQFLNGLNHMEYSDPSINLLGPSGFGALTGQYNPPRTVELGLRIYF